MASRWRSGRPWTAPRTSRSSSRRSRAPSRGLAARAARIELGVAEGAVAQAVEGRVVGDAVEPGLHVHLAFGLAQGVVGAHEYLLDGVFRPRAGEDALAVPQQRPAVAGDQRLEGAVVARADKVHEALVGLRAQQRLAGEPGGSDESTRGHLQESDRRLSGMSSMEHARRPSTHGSFRLWTSPGSTRATARRPRTTSAGTSTSASRAPATRPYMVLNMVSTLDGKATVDGQHPRPRRRPRPGALPRGCAPRPTRSWPAPARCGSSATGRPSSRRSCAPCASARASTPTRRR